MFILLPVIIWSNDGWIIVMLLIERRFITHCIVIENTSFLIYMILCFQAGFFIIAVFLSSFEFDHLWSILYSHVFIWKKTSLFYWLCLLFIHLSISASMKHLSINCNFRLHLFLTFIYINEIDCWWALSSYIVTNASL